MKICWAIQTKFPKDGGEHRVLASSAGRLNASDYDQLISKWLTGGMPQDATDYNPGAPWYQFGVDGEGRSSQQVVIKQEWSEYGDVLIRPVRITTCLLIPFDDLAKSSCGFAQMAGLFEQKEVRKFLSERRSEIQDGKEKLDCEPLEISLPDRGESLSWINSKEHNEKYAFYQRAAYVLLRGKLGLMTSGGDIPSVDERLKWLDKALALLPYGVRAYCPASLWASGSSEHGMWLYWGRSARQGHASLTIPPRPTAELQQPLDEYLQIIDKWRSTTTIERIMIDLAEEKEPCKLGSPVLEVLKSMSKGNPTLRLSLRSNNPSIEETSKSTSHVADKTAQHQSKHVVSASNEEKQTKSVEEVNPVKKNSATGSEKSAGGSGKNNANPEENYRTDKKSGQLSSSTKMYEEKANDLTQQIVDDFINFIRPEVEDLQEKAFALLQSDQEVILFEKLLNSWMNLDKFRKMTRTDIFIDLLDATLREQMKINISSRGLFEWVGLHLPDEMWYEWINRIWINRTNISELSLDPLIESLRQIPDKGTNMKDNSMVLMLKIASGQADNGILCNEYLWDFEDRKKDVYALWLIQFAAECNSWDADKVFDPVSKWMLKRKKSGVHFLLADIQHTIKAIKKYVPPEKLTTDVMKVFEDLKS